MANINESFTSISNAADCLLREADWDRLSDKYRGNLVSIRRDISCKLPAIQYAIDLLDNEPELVVGKLALAIACSELRDQICTFYAIRSPGDWNNGRKSSAKNAMSDLDAYMAMVYLDNNLTRIYRKLCSGYYR